MGLTTDVHDVDIEGVAVQVRGTTGAVHATWELLIAGEQVDSAAAAGDFTLTGALPDGSPVRAAVHQSLVGPTRVVVRHGEREVAEFRGFVA
jgi:hypothetical protein